MVSLLVVVPRWLLSPLCLLLLPFLLVQPDSRPRQRQPRAKPRSRPPPPERAATQARVPPELATGSS